MVFIDFRKRFLTCLLIFDGGRRSQEPWGRIEADRGRIGAGLEAMKMAENYEKRCFTFVALLTISIGVSGSLTYAKR